MRTVLVVFFAALFALGSGGCSPKLTHINGVGVGVSIDVESIAPKYIIIPGSPSEFVYAIKFLCGTIQHGVNPQFPASDQPLVPGTYLTAINIFNPYPFEVQFTIQIVVTYPAGYPPAQTINVFNEKLGAKSGLEIDCEHINKLLGVGSTLQDLFLKGFVVITTTQEPYLDVVAVYTLKNVVLEKK
jgi:hypothetical protein